jgi:hypothetical protein
MITGLQTTEVIAAARGKTCIEEINVPICRYYLDLDDFSLAKRPR